MPWDTQLHHFLGHLKNLPCKMSELRFPGFLYTILEYVRSP